MIAADADARFLKRIFVMLIAGTIATGGMVAVSTFKTELANPIAAASV